MEPAQPITTHGHAGVLACPTGQGVMTIANAVSAGSHPDVNGPQPMGVVAALAGIGMTEGAKNSIAVMTAVLTIFRICLRIAVPCVPGLTDIRRGDRVEGASLRLQWRASLA